MSTRPRRPDADDGLFIVGLVGRTGSGKSTVARALAEDGAVVIEGDALGHDVTDRDPEVREALIAEYGRDIYLADGALDRGRVAARVFSDPGARSRLDRLVHPGILQRIHARLERLRREGFRGVVVLDAALLIEWGLERGCDAVIAVTAPEPDQIGRLMRSRGWSQEEARHRLGAQRPQEWFSAAADSTLENRGTPEDLERDAREGVARFKARRPTARPAAREEPC
jgi:dephospho-CoA kinase